MQTKEKRFTKEKTWIISAWVVSALLLIGAIVFFLHTEPVTVAFPDVGQGDACLIRAGNGGTVLVDTGSESAAATVESYLREENVKRLDALVISHFHEDHAGAVMRLLKTVSVGAFYFPAVQQESKLQTEIIDAVRSRNIPMTALSAEDCFRLGEMQYTVLSPGEELSDAEYNDQSLVLRLNYRGATVLLCGDAEQKEEEFLVARYGDGLRSDLMKVPHHGGKSSASEAFFRACSPEVAVISVGVENRYRDPSAEAECLIWDTAQYEYRTDLDGAVKVYLKPDGIRRIETGTRKWRNLQ